MIDAEGELQASEKFLEAAKVMSANSQAMQLRYLTTLQTIATDKSSTIVFPFPIDVLRMLSRHVEDPLPSDR